VPHSPQNHPH